MNLKEYNPENSKVVKAIKEMPPAIRMCTEDGRFVFNRAAIRLIGFEDYCKVVFLQDEDQPEDWYIEIVKDNGFQFRLFGRWGEGKINNVITARKIAESVGFNGKAGRMLIAGQPTKIGDRTLWGVLAINLKNI